jgi:hypothetical protein
MELLEGNYSQNYVGDGYWGNSIDITVFRNHLSTLRAAAPPFNTYIFASTPCTYPYGDFIGRTAVNVQAFSYRQNFVGNVLGMQNSPLLSTPLSWGCFGDGQNGFAYEDLNDSVSGNKVVMWSMGADQSHQAIDGNWGWENNTYTTQLREGNWDWFTRSQKWHGIGGTQATVGTPKTIPNSLYLTSKPAFFGSNTWPWVDPTTGTTHTLPAMARFKQLRGITVPIPPGFQTGTVLPPPPIDTTAPTVNVTAPSGQLNSGTTQTTLTVTTNEVATCAWSATAGQAFASMTTFTTTGGST